MAGQIRRILYDGMTARLRCSFGGILAFMSQPLQEMVLPSLKWFTKPRKMTQCTGSLQAPREIRHWGRLATNGTCTMGSTQREFSMQHWKRRINENICNFIFNNFYIV